MAADFHKALLDLSTLQRRELGEFLIFLSRKRRALFTRGQLLNALPLDVFDEAEIGQNEIESIAASLRALYGPPDTSAGVAAVHHSVPRIRTKGGQQVVEGLFNIPVADILEELATMNELPISFGKRIPVCISEKKGIYLITNRTNKYEIRGKRLEMVINLYHGKQLEQENAAGWSNLSRDVADINATFQKKLNTLPPLIDHSSTSGYFLNDDAYEFMFEELSTKLITD